MLECLDYHGGALSHGFWMRYSLPGEVVYVFLSKNSFLLEKAPDIESVRWVILPAEVVAEVLTDWGYLKDGTLEFPELVC